MPQLPTAPFGAPAIANGHGSRHGTVSPVSVFDGADQQPADVQERRVSNSANAHGAYDRVAGDDDNTTSYDLKPPPPSISLNNVESLAVRFFSADHLNVILRDQALSQRFSRFLHRYKPQFEPLLKEYLETQKVISAVEYANAIADQIQPTGGQPTYAAVSLDEGFELRAQDMVEELVLEALPAYVTHRLTQLATENLVKEITGQGTPLMREMIPSLAEVYCVTDPSLPDNPIVYASEGRTGSLHAIQQGSADVS